LRRPCPMKSSICGPRPEAPVATIEGRWRDRTATNCLGVSCPPSFMTTRSTQKVIECLEIQWPTCSRDEGLKRPPAMTVLKKRIQSPTVAIDNSDASSMVTFPTTRC
jgi:hypothetical protein